MDFFDFSSSEENPIFNFLDNANKRMVNKENIFASEYENYFRLATKDTSGDWHTPEVFIQELYKIIDIKIFINTFTQDDLLITGL